MQTGPIQHVVIMGAGPAGITAACELNRHGIRTSLIERESQPGGLARTIQYKGYRFDIGGHRFYTKMPKIQAWWESVLGDDFLIRKRLSRILYRGKYLDYPLKAWNILSVLGPVFCLRAFASYLAARLFPRRPEKTFEDWVINHFGRMLYDAFFKSYTEKVWGIPCDELSASWAAQRIRGLSFSSVIRSLLFKRSDGPIKSLIEEFYYPRLGPGQMWETALQSLSEKNMIHYEQKIDRVEWKDSRVVRVVATSPAGSEHNHEGDYFLSSIAMQDLIAAMGDQVPELVKQAAKFLGYRDFITVALMIGQPDVNPDNWLYIHTPGVKVGRIQNFKNWSSELVPDSQTSCLGLEYFCNKGDAFWQQSDEQLIAYAKEEIETIGLAAAVDVTDGKVLRVEQAYPVYDAEYETHVRVVRQFLDGFSNLQLIGRNGMHKYNNQDHAMLTAMLAVENIMGASHDIWKVNSVEEYLED